ncbi:MAG: hypothetical protein IT405_03860 [Candidatus Yanofskybacteria bacterium]|nr:hypothetical protein [Candidatus Yanofskybacteria bacterium]
MSVSWSQFSSDIAADVSTIALDVPGSGYDRLHQLLQQRILPDNRAAQLAISAISLVASRLAQQRFGPTGPIGNYVREVAEDGIREEVKRIIEHIRSNEPTRSAENERRPAPLWELGDEPRTRLLAFYGSLDPQEQRRLRDYILRATATELAVLAGLPHEHQRLVLSIVSPAHTATPSLATRIRTVVDNACQGAAETLWPWTTRKE